MFRVLSFTKHRNAQQIPSLSIVKLTKPCNAQKNQQFQVLQIFAHRPPIDVRILGVWDVFFGFVEDCGVVSPRVGIF